MAAPVVATILEALNDNADYAETNSTAKAALYATACRRYLFAVPKNASAGGDSTSMNPDLVARELERVEAWIETHSTTSGGPRATKCDFRNFR